MNDLTEIILPICDIDLSALPNLDIDLSALEAINFDNLDIDLSALDNLDTWVLPVWDPIKFTFTIEIMKW